MPEELALFTDVELTPWKREWQNMPEYALKDMAPRYQITVNFRTVSDVEDFAKRLGCSVAANGRQRQAQSIWYPDSDIVRMVNKRYRSEAI